MQGAPEHGRYSKKYVYKNLSRDFTWAGARGRRDLKAERDRVGEDDGPEGERLGADWREQDARHVRMHLPPDAMPFSSHAPIHHP